MSAPVFDSVLTCPHCGFAQRETMPLNACVIFYECGHCNALLRSLPGRCCVFCSYGSEPCPPVQTSESCCTTRQSGDVKTHDETVNSIEASPTGPGWRGTAVASLAALGGILVASSCCLPIRPFIAAAGLAGSSAFLSVARPYLLIASVLCIGYGFYQARRARKCHRRSSVFNLVLLWVSAAFVFLSIFFPQVMANAAAELLSH